MKNKKAFEFNFGWLFALIIGAVVIFLAIYAATSLIKTFRYERETLEAQEITNILSSLEMAFEGTKADKVNINREMIIFNKCTTNSAFGAQKISVSGEKLFKGVDGEKSSAEITSRNKYVFSNKKTNIKNKMFLISKSIYFPYKIADIIIMLGDKDKYCIVGIPPTGDFSELRDKLRRLDLENLQIETLKTDCENDAETICFPSVSEPCNTTIDITQKIIKKQSGDTPIILLDDSEVKYALFIASIFSEPSLFNCQLARLMKRSASINTILQVKSAKLTSDGCSSIPTLRNLVPHQNSTIILSNAIIQEESISSIKSKLDDLKTKSRELNDVNNANANCKIF